MLGNAEVVVNVFQTENVHGSISKQRTCMANRETCMAVHNKPQNDSLTKRLLKEKILWCNQ